MIYVPPNYTDLRTWAFERNPFHCDDCGCQLKFKNAQFNYHNIADKKQSLMLHSSLYKLNLCGKCLAVRIRRWFNTPLSDLTQRDNKYDIYSNYRCDVCRRKRRRVARIITDEPWIDIRFGTTSWNGAKICCECLVECAERGTQSSGMSSYENGKRYHINEAGARILAE